MPWGIIIALVLTLLIALLVTGLNGRKKLTTLSYIVLAVGFLLLWLEASGAVGAIEAKRNLTATVANVGDIATTVGSAVGANEIVDYSVSELAQRANDRIERTANRTMIVCIILMVLTSVLTYFITERTMQGVGGVGGASRRRNDDEGYSTSTRYEDF